MIKKPRKCGYPGTCVPWCRRQCLRCWWLMPMTDEEIAEQRRSFVYGNVNLSNPAVTRELVDEVDRRMREGKGPSDGQ